MEKVTVLLVDNNERFLKTVQEYLNEQDFIAQVTAASTDTEGLRVAREMKPDLILLDVLLPGLNGIDLIPSLRRQSPNSKIIMLTLWDMNGYRDSALSAGADGFVAKRSMTENLLSTMRKVALI